MYKVLKKKACMIVDIHAVSAVELNVLDEGAPMPNRESNKTYEHSGDAICVLQIFFITYLMERQYTSV